MKPIRSVWGGAVVTTVLIVGLAFAASLIPQSDATEPLQRNSPKIEAQSVASDVVLASSASLRDGSYAKFAYHDEKRDGNSNKEGDYP